MCHHLSGASGSFPVQSSGTQPYTMFVPPENFYPGAGFVGKDKSSSVMPCCVKFVLNVLCQGVGTARITTGFTASQTLSGISMAKRPEYISQLRCPAAQSDTTGQI